MNTNVIAVSLFTLLSLFVSGQPLKAESAGKYGVVDMQSVILSVEEGKAARASLEKEIKAKESELTKKKEELDKLNKEWKEQAALLSEDARMKKQQDFQEKFMALRNQEMEFQSEIKRKEQKATQEIAIKVAQVVEKLARDKKLVAVFETNSAGLLYLENPIDLSQEVITEYGKKAKK
jgi:outer membrane protein